MDRELEDNEIRYGPSLCPGCNLCSHCRQQRTDIADMVNNLCEWIVKLEMELDEIREVIERHREVPIGYCEGDVCGREGCQGILKQHPVENCSCHMGHPPCGQCTTPREYCPVCEWDAEEDEL